MGEEKHTINENGIGEEQKKRMVPAPLTQTHSSSLGPILGILLIILVLILSGLYLWGATLSENTEREESARVIPNNEPETPRAVADTQILDTVSSSDSLEAIKADIESTVLDSLDSELNEIDHELKSALSS